MPRKLKRENFRKYFPVGAPEFFQNCFRKKQARLFLFEELVLPMSDKNVAKELEKCARGASRKPGPIASAAISRAHGNSSFLVVDSEESDDSRSSFCDALCRPYIFTLVVKQHQSKNGLKRADQKSGLPSTRYCSELPETKSGFFLKSQ